MTNTWVISASADEYHPNRSAFRGVLTTVDTPSDKSPSGARGHQIVITREAALKALPSLIGMAVGFKADWSGHDVRAKCGVITDAIIEGKELIVRGFLYGRDYPEVVKEVKEPKKPLGMSYELADAHVTDMRASVWTLNRFIFTGAAILYRHVAAYRTTSFELVPA